ncbi:hypothetical protein K469DRAFT_693883 [Zopfia rhizophila CBS 207.26]|uniref:Uncharacterized protein n=1 Tax=Zopfia rhizophila CBS 207.26 TaxID=1314779 RepID=A0A6A6DKJ3_9PEZI|nr:hypothetical protein K469DRAFT_693883 [Zopfia rhizophila CBS 207.26]
METPQSTPEMTALPTDPCSQASTISFVTLPPLQPGEQRALQAVLPSFLQLLRNVREPSPPAWNDSKRRRIDPAFDPTPRSSDSSEHPSYDSRRPSVTDPATSSTYSSPRASYSSTMRAVTNHYHLPSLPYPQPPPPTITQDRSLATRSHSPASTDTTELPGFESTVNTEQDRSLTTRPHPPISTADTNPYVSSLLHIIVTSPDIENLGNVHPLRGERYTGVINANGISRDLTDCWLITAGSMVYHGQNQRSQI